MCVCVCVICNFSDSILVMLVLLNLKCASFCRHPVNTIVVAVRILNPRPPCREYDLCLQRQAYPQDLSVRNVGE